MNGMIPESMPSLPIDIEYKKTNQMTFELCAQFNRESVVEQDPRAIDIGYPMKESLMQNNDWSHKAGYYCFERIIDPISYPTQVRG